MGKGLRPSPERIAALSAFFSRQAIQGTRESPFDDAGLRVFLPEFKGLVAFAPRSTRRRVIASANHVVQNRVFLSNGRSVRLTD